MAGSLYVPDPSAQDTLVQPWDEAFRVRTPRAEPSILGFCGLVRVLVGAGTRLRHDAQGVFGGTAVTNPTTNQSASVTSNMLHRREEDPQCQEIGCGSDGLLCHYNTQRDVGLLVPINFHTAPLVSLRAACFSNGLYEDTSFQRCFSNLLAVGLRRFMVDTYWDASRGEWSLCPAEIPPAFAAGSSSSTVPVPTFTASSSLSPTSAGVTATVTSVGFPKRQDAFSGLSPGSITSSIPSSMSSSASASASSSGSSSAGSSSAAATSSTPVAAPDQAPGGIIFQLGSYNCTSTITLGYLTSIFNDFLDATSTTTDASFTYLLLNIHAAASWEHPDEPAQQPSADQLPGAGHLLSDVMNGNLSEELYRPSKLASDRAHLSQSWTGVGEDNMPLEGYYTVNNANTNDPSTADGWPTEAYVQFHQYFRLLAIFGTIDPQMAAYNQALDADTIFPASTLSFQQHVSLSSTGNVTSGCLFDAAQTSINSQTNSSFALTTVPSSFSVPSNPNLTTPLPEIANLTVCGLSPFLNHSLTSDNTTAATNPLPYAAFTHSYLWSWAPGEPLNATDPNSSGATGNRCAAAYTSGAYPGQWHVVDCSAPLRVACQDPSQPYSWSVSSRTATYDGAEDACAEPATFSVPHTPLENAHLLSAVRSSPSPSSSPSGGDSILLNLNSMDIADCWVATPNGTCPYRPPSDIDKARIVVVPTVAAVIIFVCAALTFFVKCASNRLEDKRGRRRRTVGGWEYEGVPILAHGSTIDLTSAWQILERRGESRCCPAGLCYSTLHNSSKVRQSKTRLPNSPAHNCTPLPHTTAPLIPTPPPSPNSRSRYFPAIRNFSNPPKPPLVLPIPFPNPISIVFKDARRKLPLYLPVQLRVRLKQRTLFHQTPYLGKDMRFLLRSLCGRNPDPQPPLKMRPQRRISPLILLVIFHPAKRRPPVLPPHAPLPFLPLSTDIVNAHVEVHAKRPRVPEQTATRMRARGVVGRHVGVRGGEREGVPGSEEVADRNCGRACRRGSARDVVCGGCMPFPRAWVRSQGRRWRWRWGQSVGWRRVHVARHRVLIVFDYLDAIWLTRYLCGGDARDGAATGKRSRRRAEEDFVCAVRVPIQFC
ncbi:hypothetical protein PSPO01_09477 [Paraphaeosphaeria sporulosa]